MHAMAVRQGGALSLLQQGSRTLRNQVTQEGLEQENCTCAVQVQVEDADIKLQGCSLKDLLEKYFVSPDHDLLPSEYWTGYKGFEMVLIVSTFNFSMCA